MATYKSKAAEFLDEFFSSGPDLAARYEYTLTQLRGVGPLAQTTSDLGAGALPGVPTLAPGLANKKAAVAAQRPQFESFWLNGPAGPGVEQKMRVGYLRAVEFASRSNPPKPLETLWMSDEPRFYMEVLNGTNRVTVIVHTPLSRPYDAAMDTESASFAIGRLETDGEPSIEQTSGLPDESAS